MNGFGFLHVMEDGGITGAAIAAVWNSLVLGLWGFTITVGIILGYEWLA